MSISKEERQSIFRILFGDIQEKDVPTSIFSQSNPFRVNADDTSATNHVPEKRKKDKKSKSFVGSDFDDEVGSGKRKKQKKSDSGNAKLGFHENEDSKNMSFEDSDCISNLENEFTEVKGGVTDKVSVDEKSERTETNSLGDGDNTRKKNHKRKRREIEQEYEEKLHGVPKQEDTANQRLNSVIGGKKRKKVDDPSEIMVAEEEIDEEDKFMRTIFVGNLDLGIKKKAILKEFRQFGEIESLRLRSIPLEETKMPRKVAVMKKKINYAVGSAHAYIVFKEERSVQDSLSHNMCVFGGNHIRVDRACPPKKKLKGYHTPVYDKKRTVFIGNLPFNVKDEDVYQLFLNIKNLESNIEAVRVIRDPQMRICKGIAYVLMKAREAANTAVKKRLKLHDRELRLSLARDECTSSNKRKLLSSSSSSYLEKKRMPYEGIRSNKEAAKMRVTQKNTDGGEALRQPALPHFSPGSRCRRKGKRPAVAARKAKAIGFELTAQKRKHGRLTPGSSSNSKFRMNKKTKY